MSGKRTGVYLTPEQLRAVKDEFASPVISIGERFPDPWGLLSRYAVEQGLPETEMQYGADLRTGELLAYVLVHPKEPTP